MNWIPFVPDDIRATEGALCFKLGQPELWYPADAADYLDDGAVEHVIATCNRCPVRPACLDIALRVEVNERDGSPLSAFSRWGIWGGMTPGQRARLAGAA